MSVRRVVERITPRPAPRVVLGTAAGEVSGGRVAVDLGGAVVTAACAVPGVTAGVGVRMLVHGNGATVLHAQDPAGTLVPVGGIVAWKSGVSIPDGWIACTGTYSSATWPRLYAVLGTTTLPAPTAPTGCVWIIRAT
ncbi:MAG: tail fiber protein [Propionivibrio sp.]|nr:tail fiber protein [Propionivibrio sp.]